MIKRNIITVFFFILCIVFMSCNKTKKNTNKTNQQMTSDINDLLIESLAQKEFSDCISYLKKGANPNLSITFYESEYNKKEETRSILFYSLLMKQYDLSKVLIECGANFNCIEGDTKITPFTLILNSENVTLIDLCLSQTIDYFHKDYKGLSYWGYCLYNQKHTALYELLKDEKFNEIIKNDNSIWWFLILSWNKETPKIIENIFGEDIIIPEKEPVVSLAITQHNIDAVKFLYSHGVDFSIKYPFVDEEDYFMYPLDMANGQKDLLLNDKIELVEKPTEDPYIRSEIEKCEEVIGFIQECLNKK